MSRIRLRVLSLLLPGLIACGNESSAPLVGSPPLLTNPLELRTAMQCTSSVTGADRPPLLLIHGTALDTQSNFRWNWLPALEADGRPYCTVDLVEFGLGDLQDSAERVVFAIREMAALSGQKVQVVGYSQGGLVPRFALKYWPDLRPLVEDLVTLAGSHHGTLIAEPFCLTPCAPSIWQQAASSNLLAALNSDGVETHPEIDYTSIYTLTDEVVFPNLVPGQGSSVLRNGGTNVVNIAVQELCPLNPSEHLEIGTSNPVAWRLALDALDHPGPADRSRLPLDVCAEIFMPGVNTISYPADFAHTIQTIGQSIMNGPRVPEEPPLRCYVNRSC